MCAEPKGASSQWWLCISVWTSPEKEQACARLDPHGPVYWDCWLAPGCQVCSPVETALSLMSSLCLSLQNWPENGILYIYKEAILSVINRVPGEIKSREVELDPQVSPEEIISREVDLGCESWTSFTSGCSSTAVQYTLSLWLCPSTAIETAIAQCTSHWAVARGHRLNISIVLAAVHGLSSLLGGIRGWAFTLSPSPPPPIPIPNKQPRFCGRKATWSILSAMISSLRIFEREIFSSVCLWTSAKRIWVVNYLVFSPPSLFFLYDIRWCYIISNSFSSWKPCENSLVHHSPLPW